jgi:hypothetical protein
MRKAGDPWYPRERELTLLPYRILQAKMSLDAGCQGASQERIDQLNATLHRLQAERTEFYAQEKQP